MNNARYIGNTRREGKSYIIVTDETKDEYASESDTKKECNRRLILQYQETYLCPDNGRNFWAYK